MELDDMEIGIELPKPLDKPMQTIQPDLTGDIVYDDLYYRSKNIIPILNELVARHNALLEVVKNMILKGVEK